MENSRPAEDSSESEMFMSRADGISTGSMPSSDESGDARLPVTPNENSTDLYNLSTAARISRTPSLGSDAIDLKSFGSTWSESEQSYMDMPEDSSFSNMTTSISGVERDSMKNPGLFDHTSHSESRTELKLDDSLNSSSVDCVLDSVRNVSAEIKTVLPVAESEIAELSVHRESALCRKSLELPEVMKTVHATEDRVYDSSINPAETAFSVEAEKNGKKVPKKVHFKISESSVIAPSAPPKQKKGFGTRRQQAATKSISTAKLEIPGDSSPISSRTRLRTACQSQNEAVAAAKISKPKVKPVARPIELAKAAPSTGRSRAISKMEKSTTSKSAQGHVLRDPEEKLPARRAQKH